MNEFFSKVAAYMNGDVELSAPIAVYPMSYYESHTKEEWAEMYHCSPHVDILFVDLHGNRKKLKENGELE